MPNEPFPPVALTQKEYDTLVMLWQKLNSYVLQTVEGWQDGVTGISPDYVTVSKLVPRDYDTGDYNKETAIPVADILDPARVILSIRQKQEAAAAAAAAQRAQWERENYERLRKKFEGENTP